MKKKVAIFDRLHITNLYTGVDGSSTIRMLLADAFDLTCIAPRVTLTTEEPRPDLDLVARVLMLNNIDPEHFLHEAMKDVNVWVDDATPHQESEWVSFGNDWRDCEALVIFYRSSRFPGFDAQMKLLDEAERRGIPVIIIDMDCWMLADFMNGMRIGSNQTHKWRVYSNGPERWDYIRNSFSFDHHEHPMRAGRPFDLTYIGNDYNRRAQMMKLFVGLRRCLAGNWDRGKEKPFADSMMSSRMFMETVLKITDREFMGATPHFFVHTHYSYSKASLYVQPHYYDFAGNTTLRFFESLDVGCAPIIAKSSVCSPILEAYAHEFPDLIVNRASEVKLQLQLWQIEMNDSVFEWAKEYDDENKDDMIRELKLAIN